MTAQRTQAGSLPPEAEMDRQDALDAFLAVLNYCKPAHPYVQSPYPLERSDVDFGVTRTYHAKCGPRSLGSRYTVAYYTRMTHIRGTTRAEHLGLLVHEISHIPSIPEYESGSHPPAFWREMAFNAMEVIDALSDPESDIPDVFGQVSEAKFKDYVVNNPNRSMTDRRYETVEERQTKQRELVADYQPPRGMEIWRQINAE